MYYFASDIHLGSGGEAVSNRIERRFVEWLSQIGDDAETLVLAGDIFDFWFEYGQVVPKGFVRTLGKLAQLTDRGVRVIFLTGNHDMWLTDYLARECGVEIYTSPQLLHLAGRRIFVAHGDNMNVKGQLMLRLMNRIFRSRAARCLFSWIVHPDIALRFGRWWSGKSRLSHQHRQVDTVAMMAPLVEYAGQYAASHEVDAFIFGHIHSACATSLPDGRPIYFTGDWHSAPNCIAMDDEGHIEQKILD